MAENISRQKRKHNCQSDALTKKDVFQTNSNLQHKKSAKSGMRMLKAFFFFTMVNRPENLAE